MTGKGNTNSKMYRLLALKKKKHAQKFLCNQFEYCLIDILNSIMVLSMSSFIRIVFCEVSGKPCRLA